LKQFLNPTQQKNQNLQPNLSNKEINNDTKDAATAASAVLSIKRELALQAIRDLIIFIGDDPDRPGLVKTPERVIRAWEQDWGQGYSSKWIEEQKTSILNAQFSDGADGYSTMAIVRDIPFYSFCEHHLAQFSGKVNIGYIPQVQGTILGLSKLSRIVNLFSKRLQVQERLTTQIADFINDHIQPIGVGVVIVASHSCMTSRGVRVHGTDAVTSALRGEMLTKPEVRQEFLKLIKI
jgi:GTP cyclohydrolase I